MKLRGGPANQAHCHDVHALLDCDLDAEKVKAEVEAVDDEWFACVHSEQVFCEMLPDKLGIGESFFQSP